MKNVQKSSIKPKDRMRELIDLITRYNHEYYVMDTPSVSDDEWDALYLELQDLEKQTGVILPNSPTQKVGGGEKAIKKGFKKHKHIFPLYSLDKAQTVGEVEKWYQGIVDKFPGTSFTAQFKYDGLALVLTYEDGKFVKAATRGDGKVGEDVTEQARMIKSVPDTLKTIKAKVEICGEGVMSRSVLATMPEFKNARNAVAGAIRNIDPQVTAERNLDFLPHDVKYVDERQEEVLALFDAKFHRLKDEGFRLESVRVFTGHESGSIIEDFEKKRAGFHFDTDGIVFTVNDLSVREELGYTIKFPRWAIAYKFEAEVATTKLNDVVWQVGRSGKVTPVAILEPVELCGATIVRATLNNYGDVLRKNVSIGGEVTIRRSNDVIPEVLGGVGDGQSNVVDINECPSCGSILETVGANKFCKNLNCSARVLEKFSHFVSRDCMNIEGLSDKTLEVLIEKRFITKLGDIYRITAQQLAALDGFKDKKINNLLESINKSKDVVLARLINALGIPNIGKKASGTLASAFVSIDEISSKSESDLVDLDEFGEIMAQSVVAFLAEHKQEINDLLGAVNVQARERIDGVLSDLRICITGTLAEYTRSQLGKIIESLGGIVVDSVSKATNVLIVGESAGGKLAKAQKLGIKIIEEKHLSEFLSDGKM